jgi:hypothetical protein
VCTTCQPTQEPRRRRSRNAQREVEATRARGRALRRLALKYPEDYRAACQRRLEAARLDCRRSRRGGERSPTAKATWPASIASGWRAVPTAATTGPVRARPDPPGPPPLEPEISWPSARHRSPDLAATGQPRPSLGRAPASGQHRRHGPDPREVVVTLLEQGHSPSSVAQQLGIARQTAARWGIRWRTGGAAALEYRRAEGQRFPTASYR